MMGRCNRTPFDSLPGDGVVVDDLQVTVGSLP